jgi:transposase
VPERRVICLDEMGPVSAKTYPGELWKSKDGLLAGYQPDYGRRGKTWVFGAFEPETGQAFTLCHDRRDSIGYIQLLEGVFERFPAKEWVLIADNLSTHISKDTPAALLAFDQEVQMLFIPKYCCWLNLIEPWWKQLRSLALKGRRFEDIDEVILSIQKATKYWNNHRYPYNWGKKANPLAILNTSP